jgi:transmembrane 9 superfamily protein 3
MYLHTHMDFIFTYNNDQIISVNLTMGGRYPILESSQYPEFTYSVSWFESSDYFADRFDRYLDSEFFEHKIHWFSIFNSFMMVLFLTVFVSIIFIRTLRMDLARYDSDDHYGDLVWDCFYLTM